jgi:hypothetical protein
MANHEGKERRCKLCLDRTSDDGWAHKSEIVVTYTHNMLQSALSSTRASLWPVDSYARPPGDGPNPEFCPPAEASNTYWSVKVKT